MKTQFSKIAFAVALAVGLCFAQNAPEKLAIYVFGASDAGINKSLGSKLLVALTQNGEYAGIADQGPFQDELAKSGVSQISQAAKRRGVDYVCTVDMVEAFGAYSITANLIKISNSQVIKTGSTDRALKSLDDLTAVSKELARQLLPSAAHVPHAVTAPVAVAPVAVAPAVANPPAVSPTAPFAFLASGSFDQANPASVAPAAVAPPQPVVDRVAAAKKQCAKTYNINEILFKIKDRFPVKLKDCSSKLAKDMLNPFGKKPDPKSYMMQCAVEGVKNELPEGFSSADKVLAVLTNFVQTLMNSASAGGSLDPKKLVSAVGSMNVEELLNDVKTIAATAECMVNEPYTPPFAPEGDVAESDSDGEKGEAKMSFGIRAGMNLSHVYSEYNITNYGKGSGDYGDILGMQLGAVLDIPMTDWLYFQPGLMYIQKGMRDTWSGKDVTAHYLELPLLLSLKLSVFRFGVGPYIGLCLSSDDHFIASGLEIGLSTGIGFDIGMFYIGAFYDYDLAGGSTGGEGGSSDANGVVYHYYKEKREYFNRTLGLNFGVNL